MCNSDKIEKVNLNTSPIRKQFVYDEDKHEKFSMSNDKDFSICAVKLKCVSLSNTGISTVVTTEIYTMKDGSKKIVEITKSQWFE